MINKLVIFGILGVFSLTNAKTKEKRVDDLWDLFGGVVASIANSSQYGFGPETSDITQIEVSSNTELTTLAHETTEMQKPHTESIQMAAVTETVTVSELAAPGTITTETVTPKSATTTDSIVTTEAITKTLRFIEVQPIIEPILTPAPPTSTAGAIISDVTITKSSPIKDPLKEHVEVIWDGVKNISNSIEQECKFKSNTECDLYRCINRNFDIANIGSLDFVQLGECFPDTLDFTDTTLNSEYFNEQDFKSLINNLHELLETRNIREIFAILDYGLSDDEKNIKSSYAGLLYAVDKMRGDDVDLKALKMLMKSEKFNQGWNDLFNSDIPVSDLTKKLGVKGFTGLYKIVECGLKSYGQKEMLKSFLGSDSTDDTQAIVSEGVNYIMGSFMSIGMSGTRATTAPAPSPKFDLMSILINKVKNMVKTIFTVDWSEMTLADIALKINDFRVSMKTACVQHDIILPIKININEKTDDKFDDYVVDSTSIEKSEFLTIFSKEIVLKKVPKIEIPRNNTDSENEPSFASKWMGNVTTDTYIIGGFVLVGMIQIVIFYVQRRNSRNIVVDLKAGGKHEKL